MLLSPIISLALLAISGVGSVKSQHLALNNVQPRNVFSLNGMWEIQGGGSEAIPREFKHTVPVPGLIDLAEPFYAWEKSEYHYYRITFHIDTPKQASNVYLKINQAQYGTTVWLNRKEIGHSINCYTSQEYRLDDAMRWGEDNELIIRVGAKSTLPPESAVGKDQEKEKFIPGIWGDVSLIVCRSPRIKYVQVVPHIASSIAEVRVTVENTTGQLKKAKLITKVLEHATRRESSKPVITEITLSSRETKTIVVGHRIEAMKLWSPESPFLYEVQSVILTDDAATDEVHTSFGMREFTIQGKGFFLNGKRIFLKGGNIAFHRFLSDKERKGLSWDRAWIKRVLIDIPKAHNFNFFRAHIGQMYGAWYDIADEEGMLLQNEWQFWGRTGSKEQIRKEFTEWLRDNWNHPSIVIWDALNESSDDEVQNEIIPEMKKLDPTRPWEPVDFLEEHPYIYSLGPVLNDRKFGYTRSLDAIEHSTVPTMLNEFVWWWMNSDAKPTVLMNGVVERWLGPSYTAEDLLERQAFLAQELVELFRRMRVDAIQPFVHLSNNDGPTSHWFLGPIANLKPKPILAALKNAYSPFGVSIELWDRHFHAQERRTVTIVIFNDEYVDQEGVVEFGIQNSAGEWVSKESKDVAVAASGVLRLPVEVSFPAKEGSYRVRADLKRRDGSRVAWSQKIAHILGESETPPNLAQSTIPVLESTGEIKSFLQSKKVQVENFSTNSLQKHQVLVVAHGEIRSPQYQQHIEAITQFVRSGGSLVIVEPEFGVKEKDKVKVLKDLDLTIEYREDADRGGYDSYVFASNSSHALWNNLTPEHLKMFNGGFGGEVVSQHNVVSSIEPTVHARCGLELKIPAVMEISYGSGRVLISRLQLRNRLFTPEAASGLYGRRIDPVLQRYLLNLLSYANNRP